jgi:spore germination protein GerM
MKRKRLKVDLKKFIPFVIVLLLAGGSSFWLWQSRAQKEGLGVYFVKGDALIRVSRPAKGDVPLLRQAMAALLAGPGPEERDSGLTTQLPSGVKIRLIKLERKMAIVDLSRELEHYGGGSARLEGMIAQIVYTATGVPGIDKIWIWVEGEKEVVLGGEGLVLDRPLGRQDLGN